MLIAVVIVSILATIAIPSYREYVRRAQRADGRAVMLEAAQYMQRFYASNDRYDTAALPAVLTRAPQGLTLPAQAAQQTYAISIATGVTRSAYTLQAVPQGPMSSDKCGTLTLTSTGVRGASGTGVTVADCWK